MTSLSKERIMEIKKFDVAVLGGGPGGYPAAIRAAQRGKSVALIEAKELGGTCLNRGCIPSKALIAGAEVVDRIHEAKEFGIHVGEVNIDYAQLAFHKDRVIERMRKGLEGLMATNKITVFKGFGQFISPREIKIKGQDNTSITADQIIIATGSEPRNISAFPFDYERIHDSTSLLAMKTLPEKLIIVGGGVIGCEFASLYATLGVHVTILELLPRIISTEAIEVSQALTKAFIKRGIQVETGVKVQRIEQVEMGIQVQVEEGKHYVADCCLVAVGRSLNTKNIGLDKAGILVQENGMIAVNDKMQTNVDGIYAVGDIASKWWLAHVASHQGLIAADQICGKSSRMYYHAIPSVIFTHPEIATVGLSLEEATKRGYKAKVASFPFQALGKSQAALQAEGFAQIVVEEKSGQILGAQVVGYEASVMIAEMTLAIANELTVECVAETIHAHPTLPEAWLESALLGEGLPLHLPPKTQKKG
ncbi:Dihydrolipoyl dehydrogenase [Candidatus Protochlamydia amoebophila]|uniref:Dihydrolipoyl dehydrogenase n=2 Tax=Candidatus Protochlamydia amoebophila TaxID=362787 RepID=A0A0C1H9Y9_9BACT|nr:Dihydrolipoyl dehydrogenase [Candidatus Protochlamydia amoebophila]